MALSQEGQDYLDRHSMKRLTFDGINDLYQSLTHGAITLKGAIELDEVHRQYRLRQAAALPLLHPRIAITDELERRNERCIEQYGCGMFGG